MVSFSILSKLNEITPFQMKINISNQLTIGALQKEFTSLFPYLRLAIYRPVWNQSLLHLMDELPQDIQLEDFQKTLDEIKFSIVPSDKVVDVEQQFKKYYKLEVQVMRHSGNAWLITDATDNYTLEEQNNLGGEMAEPVAVAEPFDIHEQE
jgi:hypothetical protein